MNRDELNIILKEHEKWLQDEGGARADLRNADLAYADLQNADLRYADLQYVYLRSADLRGANLDFSVLPLWCGSLDMKVDARIARQIAYHFCRLDCEDPEYLAAKAMIAPFANEFHRVGECGAIEIGEEQNEGDKVRITKDAPFVECGNCAYEFNSELISEYGIKHCPICGIKLDIMDWRILRGSWTHQTARTTEAESRN